MVSSTTMSEETKSKIKGCIWIFFIVYFFAWGLSGCNANAEEVNKINLFNKKINLSKVDVSDGYPNWKFCCNYDKDRLTPDYAFKIISGDEGPVRLGDSAIKFEVRRGDCGTSPGGYNDCAYDSERHELSMYSGLTGVTWHTASFFLPNDFKTSNANGKFFSHLAIMQFHSDGDGAPGWNWSVEDRGWQVQRRTACNISKSKYLKLTGEKKPKSCSDNNKGNHTQILVKSDDLYGQWIDIVYNVKWTTKETGYMKMWINGKLAYHYMGSTKTPGEKEGFQFGIYRAVRDDTPNQITHIAYFDEFRLVNKKCSKLKLEDLGYSCKVLEDQSIRKIDKIK